MGVVVAAAMPTKRVTCSAGWTWRLSAADTGGAPVHPLSALRRR